MCFDLALEVVGKFATVVDWRFLTIFDIFHRLAGRDVVFFGV